MSIDLLPQADYVIVQAVKAQSKTASGIYLPEAAKEKPKTAKVLAVGSDVEGIKVGQQVIYKNEYEATTVKSGAEEYVIVFKKNIIATVVEKQGK